MLGNGPLMARRWVDRVRAFWFNRFAVRIDSSKQLQRGEQWGSSSGGILMVCSMLQTIKLACNLTTSVRLPVGVRVPRKKTHQLAERGVENRVHAIEAMCHRTY